jgi:hypothetical protein
MLVTIDQPGPEKSVQFPVWGARALWETRTGERY